MDFLESASKLNAPDGESYLVKFMNYCAKCLLDGINPLTNQPTDLILKEALLWAFGNLKQNIKEFHPELLEKIEYILQICVLPEFKSEVGFLRARACETFAIYGFIEFKNKDNVKLATEGVYHCMLDPQLPVRAKAAVALNCLLSQDEAIELIKPGLDKILGEYIKLMDTIDNDAIVNSLEGIVDTFGNEISPYAVELINYLVKTFFKYCEKGEKDDDDEGEGELAAAGCINAIHRILKSNIPTAILPTMADILLRIFDFAFSDDGGDFLEDTIQCLNLLLYHHTPIIPCLWKYYPTLCYIVAGRPKIPGAAEVKYPDDGWGEEFIQNMLGSFMNFIGKGGPEFLAAKDEYGQSYVELLFRVIKKVYEVSLIGNDDVDMVCANVLYFALIENHVGRIDPIIPHIIDANLEGMKLGRGKLLNAICMEVICVCFWYNARITLACLDGKGVLIPFFEALFVNFPNFKNDFNKQRVMLGLVSILNLPENEIPALILQSLQPLMKELVKMSSELLELRNKDESDDDNDEEEALDDEAEKKIMDDTIKKLQKFKNGMPAKGGDAMDDDDDSDFADEADYLEGGESALIYDSPFELVEEILALRTCLQNIQQTNPNFYHKIVACLDAQEQNILQNNFVRAEQEWAIFLKNREEEKQKKNNGVPAQQKMTHCHWGYLIRFLSNRVKSASEIQQFSVGSSKAHVNFIKQLSSKAIHRQCECTEGVGDVCVM
eukprot:TRINITY_DN9612_c0_g4_i14.p1 TRINITY_DN9612_c0_g4~~TRINITY_DN9612_c0_g4_i14.p1  ORF type:complete len:722 (-),score=286.95 TRINITY_DN9612_c0_g4_i14:171-2336(-)